MFQRFFRIWRKKHIMGRGCPKGYKQPEEVIRNRAEKNRGQTRTEEEKRRISEAIKKYYESPEARLKTSLASKKNKKTDEVIFIDENGNEQTVYQNKDIGNL